MSRGHVSDDTPILQPWQGRCLLPAPRALLMRHDGEENKATEKNVVWVTIFSVIDVSAGPSEDLPFYQFVAMVPLLRLPPSLGGPCKGDYARFKQCVKSYGLHLPPISDMLHAPWGGMASRWSRHVRGQP